jgi:beta-phosphoglucomutase-like phosphatase (HAD superfamily)
MQALLLDLDGVLVNSESLVRPRWAELAARFEVPLREDDLSERMLGRRTIDVLEDVFGLDPETARRVVAEGVDDQSENVRLGRLPEVPGAVDFVRSAKRSGLRISVVTSASLANATAALTQLGLLGQLDALVHAGTCDRGKPFPDPYIEACRQLGVDPADAVAFEDSLAGVAAVKSAGVRCVALSTSQPPHRLSAADLVLDDFRGHTPTSIALALARTRA